MKKLKLGEPNINIKFYNGFKKVTTKDDKGNTTEVTNTKMPEPTYINLETKLPAQ